MMIVGVTDWCLDEQGIGAVRECAQLGLGALQIGIANTEDEQRLDSTVWPGRLRDEADRQGILLSGIALNLLEQRGTGCAQGGAEWVSALALVAGAVRCATRLGATLVYVPAFGKNRIESERDVETSAAFLRGACRIGADAGVFIASENTLSADDNLRLLSAVGARNFRILIDTYNPRVWGHDTAELIVRLRHAIADQAHVKDGFGAAMGSAPLGEGERHACCIRRFLANRICRLVHFGERLSWREPIPRAT
jgi:sugar phosphate isomerase/epimerase